MPLKIYLCFATHKDGISGYAGPIEADSVEQAKRKWAAWATAHCEGTLPGDWTVSVEEYKPDALPPTHCDSAAGRDSVAR